MLNAHDFLASPAALAQFVADFEAGRWPKPKWSHAAHVAVGAVYCLRYQEHAMAMIRAAIIAYNCAVGTANTDDSGYHETLTGFWARQISAAVQGINSEFAAAVHAVALFGEARRLHESYYSYDVVSSKKARRAWCAPDQSAWKEET
jgi:hypothetical protein